MRKCGRVRRDTTVGVVVGEHGPGLRGLCTCGSVWSCPVCNAKVMAVRRLEIGAAIAAHQAGGGRVIFQTLTMRHHAGHRLEDLWGAISSAWATLRRGEPWKRQSAVLGLVGFLRVIEVTHGSNGWHVHVHALLFVGEHVDDQVLNVYGAWSAARWSRAVQRRGFAAPLAVGQDARLITGPADADLARYLSKAVDLGWELTSSQSKRARTSHSTEPTWSLLTAATDGDVAALARWREWEQGSSGRRQQSWSEGLRDRLGLTAERTDEELVAVSADDSELAALTAGGWDHLVKSPALIPEMLEAATRGAGELKRWLVGHDVEHLTVEEHWALKVQKIQARAVADGPS